MPTRTLALLPAITLAAVVGCRTATAERSEVFFRIMSAGTYFDRDGAEGKLDRFKDSLRKKEEETRKGDREERKDRKEKTTENNDEENGIFDRIFDEFFSEFIVKPMVYIITYPFAYDAGYNYLSYPYESECAVYIKTVPEFGNLGFTGSADYQYVSGKLYGLRELAKLRCSSGAFIDTSYTRYEEEVSDGYDHLNIFKLHVGYSFVTDEKFTVEPYVGTVSFPGEKTGVWFDVGISLDYFFRKPFSAYFNASNSFVGDTYMADLESGFGIFYKNLEARIGYRTLILEDEDISGPIIGAAVWF